MARNESDREDLLAEATGLSPCWEIEVSGEAEPVVAGYKKTGNLSLYFGGDRVYQFDAAGCLRRGYVAGDLYRSEGPTLARIRRDRTDDETTLLRYDLNAEELQAWLADLRSHLDQLLQKLECQDYRILRERGADPSEFERLQVSIRELLALPLKLSAPLR